MVRAVEVRRCNDCSLLTVHSPTLLLLAAILMAMVTTVLYAVWHFNRQLPGLRLWTLTYLCGFLFIIALQVHDQLPELVAVPLAQGAVGFMGYLGLLGARAYMGRGRLWHGYGAAAIALLVGASVYFTVVQNNFGLRFLISSWGAGAFYLLMARVLARGSLKAYPVRYLVAMAAAGHGAFLLLRPMMFRLGTEFAPDADLVLALPQWVILESIVASVLIGFGVLMLANEFTTSALRRLAEMDSLTSVFNRRAFLTLLDKALSQARRAQSDLPVLVIDLDHFKQINDTWGHKCGDDVLRHFVGVAVSCLRNEDVLGRLGGEEFAIVLPNADAQGAMAVAERLRTLVASQPVMTEHGPIALTVSVGVTLCVAGETSDAALQRADHAMYRAKDLGRNQVHVQRAPDAVVGV